MAGDRGEPIVLSILIFLLAASTTFSRFIPNIRARYHYGVVIFILTFSLVSVSGYRVDQILELAHQRLLTIMIGGSICIIISISVCPVWAGEDLNKLIAFNLEKLADFLEGFAGEYLGKEGDGKGEVDSKADKSFLEANFARWEPCLSGFRFDHPWMQYVKIGALTRKCAYQIAALHGYLSSDVHVPQVFKKQIQEACTRMSLESGKVQRELSLEIRTMKSTCLAVLTMEKSNVAAYDLNMILKTTLPSTTNFVQVIPAAAVASLLVEIVASTENCGVSK
ncbi:hypothetical protein GIB67_042063 [Kingdonia uniflora]|uniref:Aluminum-activated malate transporter n=1 Tax=Kingdonia uniflora TaxID=39325 RepID=A0A7J7MW16_9MAGN|nr:hypothetical protein GIB67_042063 [Kingdonia uniflora]